MLSRPGSDEARASRDRAAQARSDQAESGTRHSKKSRGLLREGIDVKFGFIAKHRGIWPADWLCGALGVSRGGFYAWLTRPRSHRNRSDEELGAKVRASFLASDRTYGARRVWHDLLAEGVSCGLHRIERLMRLQALRARPRRRRLPPDLGERPATAVAANVLDETVMQCLGYLGDEELLHVVSDPAAYVKNVPNAVRRQGRRLRLYCAV